MNNISKKMFHGINLNNYSEWIGNLNSIDVLEQILKSNMIYNRKDLYEKNEQISKLINIYHGQKYNEVCLAIHPDNYELKEMKIDFSYDDAFYDFIRYQISLILDEHILKERPYRITGMFGEVRVLESIPLTKNLVAIGYYDSISDILISLKEILDNGDFDKFKKIRFDPGIRDFLESDIEKYVIEEKKQYYMIKELIIKYNYTIPIVDPYTGISINENLNKEIKQLREIKEKLVQKKYLRTLNK